MKQPAVFIEKRVTKKPKKVTYEVFHVEEYKDVEGNPVLMRKSYGMTDEKQLNAEIMEYQINLDYRKNLIEMIKKLEDSKKDNYGIPEAIKTFKEQK